MINKESTHKRLEKVGKWIITYFPTFLVFVVLLSASTAITWKEGNAFHFAKVKFLFGLTSSICFATLFTALASASRFFKILTWIFVTFLAVADFFLFFLFKSRISEKFISLLMQTNAGEANEFVNLYLCSFKGVAVIFSVLAITFTLYYLVNFIWKKVKISFSRRKIGIAFIIINILSALEVAVGLTTHLFFEQFSFPTIEQLGYSIAGYASNRHSTANLELATEKAQANIKSEADTPDLIVWVIGESYSKLHSQLYGYPLPTNPHLTQEYDLGNIMLFSNAVTQSASTSQVMENVFSTYSPSGEASWEQMPLVPTLFRKAGYYVSLHDNQTTRINGDPKWDASNLWFFNSRAISDRSLDYRNDKLYAYDLDFIKAELSNFNPPRPALAIFHLMGQHFMAEKRYPESHRHFSIDDYKERTNLTDAQKEVVARYDDATLYNDSVIYSIIERIKDRDAILIYHTDHGEEVYDFRDQYGRTMEAVTPQMHKCIYDVPFIVYATPKYRERHPEMIEKLIIAAEKHVAVSDVSHMLLDLGNIESPYFNKAHSPLSTNYSTNWHLQTP